MHLLWDLPVEILRQIVDCVALNDLDNFMLYDERLREVAGSDLLHQHENYKRDLQRIEHSWGHFTPYELEELLVMFLVVPKLLPESIGSLPPLNERSFHIIKKSPAAPINHAKLCSSSQNSSVILGYISSWHPPSSFQQTRFDTHHCSRLVIRSNDQYVSTANHTQRIGRPSLEDLATENLLQIMRHLVVDDPMSTGRPLTQQEDFPRPQEDVQQQYTLPITILDPQDLHIAQLQRLYI